MTSALLTELLKSLGYLSLLLLMGTYLRAKIPVFQKVFLPASVIGGFIGLLLGPRIWGIWGMRDPLAFIGVTEDMVNIWSMLPGILIIPIFACVPLGMFTNKKGGAKKNPRKKSGYIFMSCGLFLGLAAVQNIVGYSTNLLWGATHADSNLYRTFGYELSQGFVGGHGTAGAVGRILEGFGDPNWEIAQGVTSTTATVGLIGGMIIGILMINYAARKGKTTLMQNPKDVPTDMRQGFNTDVAQQKSLGRETTFGSSIETISLHLALILLGVILGYGMQKLLGLTGIPTFTSLPVWFYALFAMLIMDFVMAKLKLNWLIDSKVRSRISGAMSDFAIVAAIASIPVKAVAAYIVPLTIMMVIGLLVSWVWVFGLYPKLYGGNAPFEHAIIAWGAGTGVMINGMMLLKICDPDYETPALVNFSMGFSAVGILNIVTGLYTMPILKSGTTIELLTQSTLLMFALYVAIVVISKVVFVGKNKDDKTLV